MDRHSERGGYGRRLRVCRLRQKSQRRWECHPPLDPCELPRSPLPALLNNRNWTSSLELYEARLENWNRTRILPSPGVVSTGEETDADKATFSVRQETVWHSRSNCQHPRPPGERVSLD